MKVKSWLPIFPGFYESQFDYDLESEMDFLESEQKLPGKGNEYIDLTKYDMKDVNQLLYDTFEWDEYKDHVGRECCAVIENNCPFIKEIKYESVYSPREYNFTTDSINCEIELDKRAFRKWIYEHRKEVDKYLHDHLTSHAGFISFHPNNFLEWEIMTDKFRVFEKEYYVGALLDCYFESEGFDSYALFEGCEIYAGCFINYEKVAEKLKEIAETWEDNEEGVIIYDDPNQLDIFENKMEEETNER